MARTEAEAPMTVKDLIEHLRTFDENLPVAYRCCSEMTLMRKPEVDLVKAQRPRPDGWVATFGAGDLKFIDYVGFPGN